MKSRLIINATAQGLENNLNTFLKDDKFEQILDFKYSSFHDGKGKPEYSVLIIFKEKTKK